MMQNKTSFSVAFLLVAVLTVIQGQPAEIRSGNLVAGVTSEGLMSLKEINDPQFSWPVKICTVLEGCETTGEVISVQLSDGSIENRRLLKDYKSGFSCYLTERFRSSGNSIRCDIEIRGTGKPWTTEITTALNYQAGSKSSIWAPWGDPRISKSCFTGNEIPYAEGITAGQNWTDPLMPRKFFSDTLF